MCSPHQMVSKNLVMWLRGVISTTCLKKGRILLICLPTTTKQVKINFQSESVKCAKAHMWMLQNFMHPQYLKSVAIMLSRSRVSPLLDGQPVVTTDILWWYYHNHLRIRKLRNAKSSEHLTLGLMISPTQSPGTDLKDMLYVSKILHYIVYIPAQI